MKRIQKKIIDYSKDKEWACMLEDSKLLTNLIEQRTRAWMKGTDYIQPGLLSGQILGSVLRETVKSISNHLDNFEKKDVLII